MWQSLMSLSWDTRAELNLEARFEVERRDGAAQAFWTLESSRMRCWVACSERFVFVMGSVLTFLSSPCCGSCQRRVVSRAARGCLLSRRLWRQQVMQASVSQPQTGRTSRVNPRGFCPRAFSWVLFSQQALCMDISRDPILMRKIIQVWLPSAHGDYLLLTHKPLGKLIFKGKYWHSSKHVVAEMYNFTRCHLRRPVFKPRSSHEQKRSWASP